MKYEDLTEEQRAKVRECKTPEELFELARQEGYQLSDEELETVAAGWVGRCRDFEFNK